MSFFFIYGGLETIRSNFLFLTLKIFLIKNLTLFCKLSLSPLIFATDIAPFETSIPTPVEFFNSFNKLKTIHPEPVPTSRIDIFFREKDF